jgi:hypothetical protein
VTTWEREGRHDRDGVIMRIRNIPTGLATGAYIFHSGWEWHGGEEQARGVHGLAAGAFPFLAEIPPAKFLKALAAAEMAIGAALLLPLHRQQTGRPGAQRVLRQPADDVFADRRAAQAGQRLADAGRGRGQQGHLDARHRLGLLADPSS